MRSKIVGLQVPESRKIVEGSESNNFEDVLHNVDWEGGEGRGEGEGEGEGEGGGDKAGNCHTALRTLIQPLR